MQYAHSLEYDILSFFTVQANCMHGSLTCSSTSVHMHHLTTHIDQCGLSTQLSPSWIFGLPLPQNHIIIDPLISTTSKQNKKLSAAELQPLSDFKKATRIEFYTILLCEIEYQPTSQDCHYSPGLHHPQSLESGRGFQ